MGVGAPEFFDYGVPATEGDRDFFWVGGKRIHQPEDARGTG